MFAIAVTLATFVLAVEPRSQGAAARPSILVLIGDDIDARDYGCYGNDSIRTPNIDRLAEQGLLFQSAFLTTSSCSPSRISILTGRYPHQTGAEDLHMNLPAGQTFVSAHLRQSGYFTGHMRKTHYGPEGDRQFDWYSRNLDHFVDFLDQAEDRPFFIWVGFNDAHRPYQPGAVDPPHDPAQVRVPPYLADTPETRADLALYYDEISRMDENIGHMVAELQRRKRFENTLIVFIGDNGMPFPRAKGTIYDSGISTPLVACWPEKIRPGGTTAALTSVIDLAPTFMQAAGLEKPDAMTGRSLLPLLEDPSREGRQHVFAQRNWHNCDEHIRCVRTKRFKLIRNSYLDVPFGHPSDCASCPSWRTLLQLKAAGKLTPEQSLIFRSPRPEWELYDLKSDPWELDDLAESASHADVRERLSQVLDSWADQTGDFDPNLRRRADNVDRVTGVKFTKKIGPLVEEGPPEPLLPEPANSR